MSHLDSNPNHYAKSDIGLYVEIINKWLLGDWASLCEINPDLLLNETDSDELKAILAVAHLQLGEYTQAREILSQTNRHELIYDYLISGVHNSLGKARALQNMSKQAAEHFFNSISMNGEKEIYPAAEKARSCEQYSQINKIQLWQRGAPCNKKRKFKKLFIDCGGYDGCSVIKFLLLNPDYDVITFEANPELWHYHEKLPNTLIKKAVYDYDGFIEFTVDPIDADGSSIIKEKNIDFRRIVSNEECPKLQVECIDLSLFVKELSKEYEHIEMKLDVEGAEYAILQKMVADGTLVLLKKLYAEFHWNKIGLSKIVHEELIDKISILDKDEWDAQEFAVHMRDSAAIKRRETIELFFNKVLH